MRSVTLGWCFGDIATASQLSERGLSEVNPVLHYWRMGAAI